jgi:TPR repeat protein
MLCASLPAQTQTYEAGAAQKLAADANTIVDCLLPGADPDYKSAATWYRKSAEQDNHAAAMALAALHETGP